MSAKEIDATKTGDGMLPYDKGFTVHEACKADARFSYSLYVPPSALEAGSKPRLLVFIHGTGRRFDPALQALASFGRWNNCVIMCPLFPSGVRGDRNLHGYKYIREGDIRYDLVLLAMIDEMSERYAKDFSRFMLCGFSGGGHFAHRFLLLHPDRMSACSIGAPGSVTRLDPERSWWVGIKDVPSIFGITVDLERLRTVPVHMAAGSVDLETWEIMHRPQSAYFMDGANDAGETRPERLQALKTSFEAAGMRCQLEMIPGAAHDENAYLNAAQDFFAQIIRER
ncbi:alpha/beta hydrolase [Rhizobiaceae bacterium BDR2-2]|uniref:Alpha/beta hydrolase n=1 Tax=Ectorhizobium quercum TaxID=2965071 RepID=A0AAE3N4A5_9HYPH|nr:alpha/beta hydrolase [Ectorhizobium quercum]MCX8999419.1 alpha/beta hydrolase [Ectorhizobium quercum]